MTFPDTSGRLRRRRPRQQPKTGGLPRTAAGSSGLKCRANRLDGAQHGLLVEGALVGLGDLPCAPHRIRAGLRQDDQQFGVLAADNALAVAPLPAGIDRGQAVGGSGA